MITRNELLCIGKDSLRIQTCALACLETGVSILETDCGTEETYNIVELFFAL